MQVKRYVAPSFAEALIQAKNELGTDAMIVETKKLKVGGFLGLFQREMTELTMAVDQPPGASTSRPAPTRATGPSRYPVGYGSTSTAPTSSAVKPPVPSSPPPALYPASTTDARPAPTTAESTHTASSSLKVLEREVASLRTAIGRLIERGASATPGPQLKGFGLKVYESLLSVGVDEAAALDIGQRVGAEGEDGHAILQRELERLLGPGAPVELRPGQRSVVTMVGPTGVGKTTTLAKLAAHFALERGAKVALLSADTFRIAAIEQLRTYADILGVPLYVVDTPADVANAMKETAEFDLLLVDTGGRNHRDPQRMQELKELMAVLRPDEVHLVFSLTANPADTFDAMNHYLPMGVNRLTFTKLDEATAPGIILNVRMRCNHPLGYVTHGQSVPDDITPANAADFTKILLGA